ncbi:MAG: peptidylprolyl isomerase [Candidatus Eisenbacteria bacterium]|nr:peptidylprolyl isomerase [Candidatus Eisenbacteria bacterium]
MRKRWMSGATLLLLLPALLVSCGGKEGSGGEEGSASAGDVVATVNGQEVTAAQLEAETARLFRQFGGQVSPFQAQQMEGLLMQQARDNLVNKILLAEAVESEGNRLGEEEIQARFDEFLTQFPDSAAFREAILAQGWESEEAFFEEFRRMMEIDALLEEKTGDYPKATDGEIATAYEENKDKFRQEEQVNARHILMMLKENDNEETKAAKRRDMESIRDQLRRGGDFAALAQEYSDCPSKENGGDLGWFGRNRMVEPFEEVAFSLPVGQTSDVVETRFGFHVIEVLDRREARQLPLDEVRSGIEEQLNQQHRREMIEEYLNGLRENAEIVWTDPPALEPPAGVEVPPPVQ